MSVRRAVRGVVKKGLRGLGWKVQRACPDEGVQGHLRDALGYVLAARWRKRGGETAFLQVGGFDGVTGDAIHEYVQAFRLRGVICEPLPASFARLQRTYRGNDRVVLENVAVGPERGRRPFYFVRRGVRADLQEWVYSVSSFSREHVRKHLDDIGADAGLIGTQEVRVVTFDDLLDRFKLSVLDLLQVDAEGFDWEVVRTLDLDRLAPAVLRFEHAHLTRPAKAEAAAHLIGHGYQLVFEKVDLLAFKDEMFEDLGPAPPTVAHGVVILPAGAS